MQRMKIGLCLEKTITKLSFEQQRAGDQGKKIVEINLDG